MKMSDVLLHYNIRSWNDSMVSTSLCGIGM